MRVILSSNIPHYHYTARALARAGYLHRYITSIAPVQSNRWLERVLPEFWRLKFLGRAIHGVDENRIVSLVLPELIQKGLTRSQVVSTERANWVNNYLYDWMASRYVESCNVFHFVSSIGLYSAQKAKRLGAVIICDERTEYPDFQRKVLEPEYRRLGLPFHPRGLLYDDKIKQEYGLADYLIVGSSYAKRTFVEAGFDSDRIFVVPYGFDPNYFQPGTGSDGVFRILFCGQVIPRKGVHYLLQAFEELDLPDAELMIVGPMDKTLAPLVKEKAADDPRIKVVGEVPKVRLREYYNASSVLALPSVADAQPLVCLEAMACGLPVIATENTGSQEIIRDGVDGFIVPAGDVDALKECLLRFYGERVLRDRMGRSARERILGFTWEAYEARILETYGEIARREGLQMGEKVWVSEKG